MAIDASRLVAAPPSAAACRPPAAGPAPADDRSLGGEFTAWLWQALASAVGLLLLSPVLLLLGLLVKLSSPGPVFYRGERVGRERRVFRIYKFRTMVSDAEARIGARLLSADDKDRYCTRVGRFLKRTKLDELPQLLNVVRGDMRLVGPRPVRPIFLEPLRREIPEYDRRFLVPPGITGIAQLRGGYYTSPRNKLRYDLIYITSRSPLLDLQLILLTFVKILNRWLGMGFFILFLFLFASFIPATLQPTVALPGLGSPVSLVNLFVVLLAIGVFLRNRPTDFSLYRCPLNAPILAFALLNLLSAATSEDPGRALQGSGYYVVTGFLTAFVIVNTLATEGFIAWTARIIALTSVLISLLGLLQIFVVNYSLAVPATAATASDWVETYVRASSVLGSPVVLAVYLVLGIPLLLAELTLARSQRERDFWLVCTTISFVGIFFTQTRVGLVALLVTGTVFLCRRRRQAMAFSAVFLLCFLLLVSLGLPRFSPSGIHEEVVQWTQDTSRRLARVSPRQWLLGGEMTATSRFAARPAPASDAPPARAMAPTIANMHLTLILEHGLLGWATVMWLILATVRAIRHAYDRTRDDRPRTLLWAIASSLLGYVVSMNSMNTFHHLPIQVFFWGLIGIGLAIVIRLNGHRRSNVIWRFGHSGD